MPLMSKAKETDYVTLFAERLKKDPTLFTQQKMLIESQLHSSAEFFAKMFSGKDFKKSARVYLRGIGLLNSGSKKPQEGFEPPAC